MRKLLYFLILTTAVFSTGCQTSKASEKHKSIQGLIERLLPGRVDRFRIETIPAHEGKDVYELTSENEKIVLRGNNKNSQAMALGRYLKYHCKWVEQNKMICLEGKTVDLKLKPFETVSWEAILYNKNCCILTIPFPFNLELFNNIK